MLASEEDCVDENEDKRGDEAVPQRVGHEHSANPDRKRLHRRLLCGVML